MTPEDIEYVCKWAASGNEPMSMLTDRIPWVVMYRCCTPVRIGGGLWTLSESGLTIAAQAERILELEAALSHVRAVFEHWETYPDSDEHMESAKACLLDKPHKAPLYLADVYRENEKFRDRIRELEAENADIRAAFGQAAEVAEECQVYADD